MNTRVIALARQVGVAGEEISQAVAHRLKFRYIDYQVIQEAAQKAGASPEMVSEAEHTSSLLTRVLETLARNPSVPDYTWVDPAPFASLPLVTSADYRQFVVNVIRDLAELGDCVIVGHAGSIALRDRTDTLRVLVTGSPKERAKRVMAGMAVDEKTALKTIERVDGERGGYFKRIYGIDWLAPANYDLCISTDHLSVANSVELIAAAATLR